MSGALNTTVNGSKGACIAMADWLSSLYAVTDGADGAVRRARGTADAGWSGPAHAEFLESLEGLPGDFAELANRSYECEWALRGFAESLGRVLDLMEQALAKARAGGLRIDGPFIIAPQSPPGVAELPAKKCTPQDAQVAARHYQGDVGELRAAQQEFNVQARVYNECKALVGDARRIEGRAHHELQTTMTAVKDTAVNWVTIGAMATSTALSIAGGLENTRRTLLNEGARMINQSEFLTKFANGTVASASPLQQRILDRAAQLADDGGKYQTKAAQFQKMGKVLPASARRAIAAYPGQAAMDNPGKHAKTPLPKGAVGGLRALPYVGSMFTVVTEVRGAAKGEQSWGRAAADSAATIGGGAAGAWGGGIAGAPFGPGGILIGGVLGGLGAGAIAQEIVAHVSGDEN